MSLAEDLKTLDDLSKLIAPKGGMLTEFHLALVVSEQTDGTVTILLAEDEDDNPITGVRKLRTNTPPGSVVYIAKFGGDYTVLGALDAGSEWSDYLPEVRQPAALTITSYVHCRFWRNRNHMNVDFNIIVGSAGTAGQIMVVTLPTLTDCPEGTTPIAPAGHPIGIATVNGFGSGVYAGVTARLNNVTDTPNMNFYRADINTIAGVMGQSDPNSALASGNQIRGTVRYEVL